MAIFKDLESIMECIAIKRLKPFYRFAQLSVIDTIEMAGLREQI